MKNNLKAEIGVFGGSGFYSLFEKAHKIKMTTPYGEPSSEITIADVFGKKVAFIPRHGKNHEFPPHKVPYKANIYAFKKLGVEKIISPCAAGSLCSRIRPGDFVILDQFIDRTKNREDTFFDGPQTTHIAGVDPYCPSLRKVALTACEQLNIKAHKNGTVVVINGPRFSTAAESMFYSKQGCEVINMTQYPEVVLAREQEMCFLGIALITDWDAGLTARGIVKPVNMKTVLKVFNDSLDKSRKLLFGVIKNLSKERSCVCSQALKDAIIKA